MLREFETELEEELLDTGYESSLEPELANLETEAGSSVPKGRCTPAGRRVGNFTCTDPEVATIRAFLGQPTITGPWLRAAVEDAAGRAVSLARHAADALDRSRRTPTTRQIFCEAFGVAPEFVPPWRFSKVRDIYAWAGGSIWRDIGELIAIRLRDAAKILDGGCIHYFCWATADRCPESSTPPTDKLASSSYRGVYRICLGGQFYQLWLSGDRITPATTLLHEALHIYFGTTITHKGRSGNAHCYTRFAVRLQNLFLHSHINI